ncbi:MULTISPECIES: crossover junction endodeoxyribonuclease RuvC [Variovorax]|jgi:crossover junction endodeoxyribonuclease RuvC|uniref:crossover junction endodeoxyribonuclease RuvC n=1 Tax=Variovorax TaxID=34072 RepID=UPI00086CC233|nr:MULTISPECIES: crossover junction endodeoxyribonuclease RuvC [Variovorax]MBN8756148.1 crossover junction endodeoxyribonuclease RuvC [Variovorax sp.]ODU16580.1 MAG: crossover junction endodeoxyribonuclease RuvC [Variovorax sp. SCN 67-85]ODV23702.1 MAG: crossover junction endodeoxyribonuclease RuvC [Variovorax sp. SCN 67-20]OJZ13059.1 MAG: crossover junction endodeoxyribonuclease RuvC [Variovorax sp. 67-131]UKI09655.1 crossover junction endodeoxyribonuclease RuvC [Variovorax paradoxus]
MRILGIDPGLQTTGFGVVDADGHALRYVASGTISTRHLGTGNLPARLKVLFDGIAEIAARYQPDASAVEIIFVNVNPQSTLLLGQARGACVTSLVNSNLSVAEYTALQMKKAVAGHGQAAKAQVQEMVKRLLDLPGLPGADAADALGIAITHAQVGRSMARLAEAAELSKTHAGTYRQGRSR